jgi:hypothetical protein
MDSWNWKKNKIERLIIKLTLLKVKWYDCKSDKISGVVSKAFQNNYEHSEMIFHEYENNYVIKLGT